MLILRLSKREDQALIPISTILKFSALGIVMKTFTIGGYRQFCGYQYFCDEILFYSISSYSPFFKSFKSKSTQMFRPQKRNSGVLFKDTLLNPGLWKVVRKGPSVKHYLIQTILTQKATMSCFAKVSEDLELMEYLRYVFVNIYLESILFS